MAILQTGKAHIGFSNIDEIGETSCNPGRIGSLFFDLQVIVLSIPGQLVGQQFIHLKVGVVFSYPAGYDRLAVGAVPVRQPEISHSSSIESVAGTTW